MTDFQKWKYYYDRGWANDSQLQQVVSFGKISAEEFETITGKKYTA
ncbi:XkdX family protein [Brevibacillus sp. 179-C9.3 HS]